VTTPLPLGGPETPVPPGRPPAGGLPACHARPDGAGGSDVGTGSNAARSWVHTVPAGGVAPVSRYCDASEVAQELAPSDPCPTPSMVSSVLLGSRPAAANRCPHRPRKCRLRGTGRSPPPARRRPVAVPRGTRRAPARRERAVPVSRDRCGSRPEDVGVPTCGQRVGWADADHVVPHGHGGATACANLIRKSVGNGRTAPAARVRCGVRVGDGRRRVRRRVRG
jgi:hypothetical protein